MIASRKKIMNFAVRALGIWALTLMIHAHEDELLLSIQQEAHGLSLGVSGGPGLHRLEEKEDLRSIDWTTIRALTSETNIRVAPGKNVSFIRAQEPPPHDLRIFMNTLGMLENGREIFRHDTFGSERFWGDALKLHRAITGTNHGGVGPGVAPQTAFAVGLKVDADALPTSLKQALAAGQVDLSVPATTLALLELDAVVGVKGMFDNAKRLTSLGVQCSLCHSTVDDSFAPGIGRRLDGWPNRDLNVGAIINLSPDVSVLTKALEVSEATVRTVLQSWGPGKFDAELILDGKAFRPDGESAATLLPAAFGLAGVNLSTYTGWGSVTHWNAFVSNLEMHGQGTFWDPRLNDSNVFPLAAKNGYGNVRTTNDLITAKLAALHFYQLSIPAPEPPATNFNAEAALRGQTLFSGKAQCATCHVPPLYTEPGWNMHTPEEIGIDSFQSDRSPDKRYRTTPLKGLFARAKGGFYHDGRFSTLTNVVQHYNTHFGLEMSSEEVADLVQFLRSL
jgi:hypothetical protein